MGQKLSKRHCSLFDPSPTYSTTTQQSGLAHPGEYLRLWPLQYNRCPKTKKYGPNEKKKQVKTPEKELSNEDIANLSDAEFKILVIRMPTEMVEFSCKMKATQSEIKQKI